MTARLAGTVCRLRPAERGDYVERLPAWYGDREATRFVVRAVLPQSAEDLAETFEAVRRSRSDLEWAIEADAGEVIGLAGLHSLDWLARSAEFRIFIGDRAHWNKGIGTEVTQLLAGYAFDSLQLHRVWLGVNTANRAAVTTYERSGFRVEGTLRDEVFRNGRYYDVVRMALLRTEYEECAPGWPLYPELCRQLRDSG